MLELIGIPKTKTEKKNRTKFQTENSFIAERKKEKTERTNQKERITEGKNERNDKKFT